MRELYEKDTPDYDFKYTVPVLWDAKHEKIVNNESSEILRFLNNEVSSCSYSFEFRLAQTVSLSLFFFYSSTTLQSIPNLI